MKLEYLIDGYNLMRSRSEGQRKRGKGNLERERLALLGWIGNRLADPASALVVFDAASKDVPDSSEPTREQGVRVVFAVGYETADDYIAEYCRRHSHPKQLYVVSNDVEVQVAARRRNAKILTCEEFEALLSRRQRKPKTDPEPRAKTTGPTNIEADMWKETFARLQPGKKQNDT